jgi:hypothetical protein
LTRLLPGVVDRPVGNSLHGAMIAREHFQAKWVPVLREENALWKHIGKL